jgi:hypothetical protein
MKKKMTDGTITLTIVGFFMTRNFWEYFITDDKPKESIIWCLVYGDFIEYGPVDMNEAKPYIITFSQHLEGLAPPPGWQWVESQT